MGNGIRFTAKGTGISAQAVPKDILSLTEKSLHPKKVDVREIAKI